MADVFKQVFADDFSGGYQTAKWGNPFDGGTYWNGAFNWSRNDVKVVDVAGDKELQVSVTKGADGKWTAGGLNTFKAGHVIKYGEMEFDARVEEAQGTMAAILTWPQSDKWPGDGEIDILETPFKTAMHSTHYADAGWSGGHAWNSQFSTIDPSKEHHYKLTWLPDLMKIEVDGKTVATWTDPKHIPDVAHGFGAMGFVGADSDKGWMGGKPDGTTPSKVVTHIDNVVLRQWMGDDGSTAPAPTNPTPVEPVPTTPVPVVTPIGTAGAQAGTGPDALVLKLSETAYQGVHAQFTVAVDGKQVGGTFSTDEIHGWKSDTLTLNGDWGAGAHRVDVTFLNDAKGTDGDRNLFVDSATYNGVAVTGAKLDIYAKGTQGFSFTEAAPTTPTQPTTPTTPTQPTTPGLPAGPAASLEMALLKLINEDRAEKGLGALKIDLELDKAADAHTADMLTKGYFAHDGIAGDTMASRVKAAGYGYTGAGENIAYVSKSGALDMAEVQQLHDNLMASPGHYANLMSASFKEVGLGLAEGTYNGRAVVMLTENFGTPTAAEAAETDKISASAPTAPVEPAPVEPTPTQPAPTQPTGEIDWAATAKAVSAHYAATGQWGDLKALTVYKTAPAPTEPSTPAEPVREKVAGTDGSDSLSVNKAKVDVDAGKGADLITLGADHSDVHISLDKGEVRGDAIVGFETGDLLEFHGFGAGELVSLGDGDFKVYGADGRGETFFIADAAGVGIEQLATADYAFA